MDLLEQLIRAGAAGREGTLLINQDDVARLA